MNCVARVALYAPRMGIRAIGLVWALAAAAWGQTFAPDGMSRIAGTDAGSGIEYALISVEGKLIGVAGEAPAPAPRLTAQCTKTPGGTLQFELLADVGGVAEIKYIPPWKPANEKPYHQPEEKTKVKTEFLGYIKEKPRKFEWKFLREIPGEMHYASAGAHSANLETERVYMQYLRALPTLRMTVPPGMVVRAPVTVEFETQKWQGLVKAAPLCWASGL